MIYLYLPIKNGDYPGRYTKQPEGIWFSHMFFQSHSINTSAYVLSQNANGPSFQGHETILKRMINNGWMISMVKYRKKIGTFIINVALAEK